MVTAEQEIALAYLLDPAFQIVNTAGKPLTDGWIEVYIHGTRNKYYCYSDWNGALHPFKIPLDSLGANIVLASPDYAYDIYIYNKFGSLVMSRYNVVAGKGGGGSGGIPSSTEAQHWLGQYGATQPLEGNERGQTLALPSRPDYQGDFVDHIDYGYINGDETNQYPKYMYLKPGLYLVNCVIRFQQQHGTEVNRLDETLVYTGNGNANEDIAWQLDETGPLATGDRHCLKLTFIRKVLDEGETSTVDCSNILYFAPAPQVNWNDAYIQTLQVVKLNSAVQGGGGAGSIYHAGEGIAISDDNEISVTGMMPASAMGDFVTVNVFNEFVENVTEVINNVTGDIVNIQNEIEQVSASVSAIVPEYQEGYGIVIEGDTISVDPSIIPSGCVSQEELAQVSGDIVNQIENVTGDVTEITNIVNNVTGDITNLTEVVNNVTGDVTNLTEIVEGATGDITNIITEISNVTGDIVNINENVTNLTEVVNNVTGDVTNLTEVVNNVTGDVQNLTTIVENVTGDINNLETIVNNVTGDINVLETNISNVSGDVINLTEVVEGVTGDITNLTEVVNNVTGDVSNLTEIVNGVTGDIEQLESDIQAVSAAIPPAQVQSDWAQDDDSQVDYIKNKPEETPVVAGEGISIEASGDMIVISTEGLAGTGDVANLEQQIQTVSAAIPTDVVTHQELAGVTGDYATNEDLQIVSAAIPTDVVTHDELEGVTGDYATNSDLQTVSAAVDAVSANIPETEEVEFEELDLSQFVTESAVTGLEADIQTVSSAIPTDTVTHAELAAVTGDYATNADLQIVSAAIPDVSNFATESELQAVSAGIPAAQVQSDWTESDTASKAYIQHKPNETELIAGQNITLTDTASGLVISSTGGGGAVTGDYVTHAELANVTGDVAVNASDIQTVSAAVDSVSASIPETEEVEFEELDLSSYATQSQVTAIEADIQTVSAAIPDVSNLATEAEIQFVSGAVDAVSAAIASVTGGGSVTGDFATNADLQVVSSAVDSVSGQIPSQIEVEFKELDLSNYATQSQVTAMEAEIQIVSAAIGGGGGSVTGDFVTHTEFAVVTGDIQTVSAAVDSVSGQIPSQIEVEFKEIDLSEYATVSQVTGLQAEIDAVSAAVAAVTGGGGTVTGDYATNADLQYVSAAVDSVSGQIPESEEVEFEELDITEYATVSQVTAVEADVQTVSAAIPDTSNLATEADLQTVSAAIPDVSNLATQTYVQNYTIPVQVVASSAAATGTGILYVVTG